MSGTMSASKGARGQSSSERIRMEEYMTTEKTKRLDALVNVQAGDKKPIWRKIGVAFPLKSRAGYTVKLELMPFPGKDAYELILVEPNAKEIPKE